LTLFLKIDNILKRLSYYRPKAKEKIMITRIILGAGIILLVYAIVIIVGQKIAKRRRENDEEK